MQGRGDPAVVQAVRDQDHAVGDGAIWLASVQDNFLKIDIAITGHKCHFIAMKFDVLIQRVPEYGVFTTGQVLARERSPADVRRQLNRWGKTGKVQQLRRGVYMLNNPYVKRPVHPFVAANILKRASYVSLQSALAHYGMIPEYVPVITSVTTGRPEELSTPIGRFQFRHVSGQLFGGFREVEVAPGLLALLATPYKALVDLLYLTPHSDNQDFLHELRVTKPAGFDEQELVKAAEESKSNKVMRAVSLMPGVWEEF